MYVYVHMCAYIWCGGQRSTPGVLVTFHLFFKLLLYLFIVGGEGWMHTCHSKCVVARGHLAGASFHYVSPGDWAQVVSFGSRLLSLPAKPSYQPISTSC